ncbi:MAG: hypothetical protein JNK84_01875 [Phreatobacter sp.]|uniref:hypothetical protein n=1 Tax=Phreatobacter sp. TaxID=1966341 RepID=UPI001A4E5B4A|nr:hypothetical protein [Phreatobacter sp.]MBL8567810.1 hypothetical protein [Phreatobacter sp.]
MTADGFSLAATIILLFPMLYFFIASPTFLLAKLEDPVVTWLLRSLFSFHFRAVSIVCAIGTIAFLVAGRPLVAIAIGIIAALAVYARQWFLGQLDTQIRARDAGEAGAVRELRRLHWRGMAYNAAQFFLILSGVPFVFTNPL